MGAETRRNRTGAARRRQGQPAHAAEGRAGARRCRHGRPGRPVVRRPAPPSTEPWRSRRRRLPTLSDIRHVVFLMQENRSFDHYFGTLSGVRGFSDPQVLTNRIDGAAYRSGTSTATSPASASTRRGYLQPFDLQQQFPTDNGDCTNDISHEWGHAAPELGRREDGRLRPGPPGGRRRRRTSWPTMGYFDRGGAPLLLRAGRRVHHLRRLPLLGARAHRPQSGHGAVGHHRPGGHGRRSRPRHADHRPARSSTGRSTGPPCPSSCSTPG